MNHYCLKKKEIIRLPRQAKHPVIVELLSNYTKGLEWAVVYDQDENRILIGDVQISKMSESDYELYVCEDGAAIFGASYAGVMRGFTCLLEKIINIDYETYVVEAGNESGDPRIPFRAVHLCVFPDTKKEFLRRSVRLAIMARYTHLFIEFWGTLKYESFPLLGWDDAFEKREIKEIMEEARSFGLEIIPFFQHWGHAALSRGGTGKHVVLDREIRYEYLYKPHTGGWVWDYENPRTLSILRSVRNELCELCGEGSYFHLGCDESEHLQTKEEAIRVADYINSLSAELKMQGRRAIIWGDMLLSGQFFHEGNHYECNSSPEIAETILQTLDKDIMIADWQYSVLDEIWDSARLFREKGFDVICCPYNISENVARAIDTARDLNSGVMLTTWHTLHSTQMALMLQAGWSCYNGAFTDARFTYSGLVDRTAGIIRKLLKQNEYEDFGWHEHQIEI